MWYATPLLLVTAFGLMFILPGAVVVALAGILPFVRLAPAPPFGGYSGLVSRAFVPLAAVGATAGFLGILFWMMLAVTALASAFSSPLAWLTGWAFFGAAVVFVGGLASAFAYIYGEMSTPHVEGRGVSASLAESGASGRRRVP